jgi:2-dehydro-3-deoxyphosphogluconate aldolase / (4S)-4-hydroxy-2-oxoglutarate aldolase
VSTLGERSVGVLELLATSRILPVLVIEDAARAEGLGAALRAGGARLAEVTFRTAAAEEALGVMARLDGLCAGAGTVTSSEQVDRAVAAGARFVVSPGLKAEVVTRCQEHGVPVFPGVATASEAMHAMDLGVDTVKLFPASVVGGPGAVAALAGPFPSLRFIPTGGVDQRTAADYLRLEAVLAVGGSWMAPGDLVRSASWDRITELTAHAVTTAVTCSRETSA